MEYRYLGKIKSKKELKALNMADCAALCAEIRTELIERVTENGGHMSSNLGVVEMTLAIHRVFNLPSDRLIFDVGHQCYVHKLLSDRFDRFATLRQAGGLSGFQRRDESEYDAFGGGHASTSLSAAIGFAEADKLAGRSNYTVAVVGDGAFTGGMIHEALNNCSKDLNLIIILNENEMSISVNTGRLADHISKLRSSNRYFTAKRVTKKVFSITGLGRWLVDIGKDLKTIVKRAVYDNNYFSQMGISYLGPIDGHDQVRLEAVMREATRSGGCSLIHIRTVKGKGYQPAEKNPCAFHGIAPANTPKVPSFSHHLGQKLTEMAEEDKSICAITAAMADGTGLTGFAQKHPERFFDVGIAEEHAMTFSAALSAAGMKPVYCVYSTFLQRCYDQMIHDAALQDLSVTMCIDRAGLAFKDGPTHHGLFDVSMAVALPKTTVYAPLDFEAMDCYLEKALKSPNGLTFIRYRGGGEMEDVGKLPYLSKDTCLRGAVVPSPDAVIISYGQLTGEALMAKSEAAKRGKKISVLALESVLPAERLKEQLLMLIPDGVSVLFAEEGIRHGGAGEAWAEMLQKELWKKDSDFSILAVDHPFALAKAGLNAYESYGISYKEMLKALKIDVE